LQVPRSDPLRMLKQRECRVRQSESCATLSCSRTRKRVWRHHAPTLRRSVPLGSRRGLPRVGGGNLAGGGNFVGGASFVGDCLRGDPLGELLGELPRLAVSEPEARSLCKEGGVGLPARAQLVRLSYETRRLVSLPLPPPQGTLAWEVAANAAPFDASAGGAVA